MATGLTVKSYTSKWILMVVMAAGLVAIMAGAFAERNNLIAYGLIFVGAVYNRIDSRFNSYRFSFSSGRTSASVEAGLPPAADGHDHVDPA